jgi:hypothetical protein
LNFAQHGRKAISLMRFIQIFFFFIAGKTATARTKITATKTRVSIAMVSFNILTVDKNYTKDLA